MVGQPRVGSYDLGLDQWAQYGAGRHYADEYVDDDWHADGDLSGCAARCAAARLRGGGDGWR